MISWLTAAFTYNKIPKAHYHAFQMLTGLEDTLVGSGDGWFLTRGRERLVLVLYNYSHYSRLLSAGELFDMTPTERYTSFAGLTQKKFVLRVPARQAARYPSHGERNPGNQMRFGTA